jgi:hypothetical protein
MVEGINIIKAFKMQDNENINKKNSPFNFFSVLKLTLSELLSILKVIEYRNGEKW